MNADKRKFADGKDLGLDRRLSVFISG